MRFLIIGLMMMLHACCDGVAFAATDNFDYELVAAGQTAQVMGPTTATTRQGMVLDRLIITPETTAPGIVAIKDGSGTAINVYTGGTVSAELQPIMIEIHARSVTGSWQVTTGSNVHVVAVGKFTNN